MAERIIILKTTQTCDLCGERILRGRRCRMVSDDFMPGLVFFEHLSCPEKKKNSFSGAVTSPFNNNIKEEK